MRGDELGVPSEVAVGHSVGEGQTLYVLSHRREVLQIGQPEGPDRVPGLWPGDDETLFGQACEGFAPRQCSLVGAL